MYEKRVRLSNNVLDSCWPKTRVKTVIDRFIRSYSVNRRVWTRYFISKSWFTKYQNTESSLIVRTSWSFFNPVWSCCNPSIVFHRREGRSRKDGRTEPNSKGSSYRIDFFDPRLTNKPYTCCLLGHLFTLFHYSSFPLGVSHVITHRRTIPVHPRLRRHLWPFSHTKSETATG